jgi:multicomponent Na+:H+ antiporter subunit E
MIFFRLTRQAVRVMAFGAFFVVQMVRANLRVAYDVVTVKHYMKPGILAIPLEARTGFEIAMLANLISLTPGTLSIDVSADRKTIFVHAMYLSEPEDFKRFEARFLEAVRWN